MTSYEFSVSVLWNVSYDALWKNSLNLSSRFIIGWRFCGVVLADVYKIEYRFGSF
jgi:hypothetical protein